MKHDGAADEQHEAEEIMRQLAAEHFGIGLAPRHVRTPHGGEVRIDAVAEDNSLVMEIYAHQGALRGSQPKKVMTDALKLLWSRSLVAEEARMVLALSCHEAARTLRWNDEAAERGRRQASWRAEALHDLGLEVVVFDLPDGGQSVRDAQVRQFR